MQDNSYWSGTSYASDTGIAWLVYVNGGSVYFISKSYYGTAITDFYVWPVRGTICDADCWKNLAEQYKAELDACQNPPTNIELSALDATPSDKQVILKWKTETETGNAGFNVWRADNFVKINDAVIPALGSAVSGSAYDFVDEWVLNGNRYFYLLEDIDTNGISTFHGPVRAVPRAIYGIGK